MMTDDDRLEGTPGDNRQRRRWLTLSVLIAMIAALAILPMIVRNYVRPAPVITSMARELLPDPVSKTPLVSLYADDLAWGAAIAETLPRYGDALSIVFPAPADGDSVTDPNAEPNSDAAPTGAASTRQRDSGASAERRAPFAAQPVDGVVVRDPRLFAQIWESIFKAEPRPAWRRGVGRESFFLVDASNEFAQRARAPIASLAAPPAGPAGDENSNGADQPRSRSPEAIAPAAAAPSSRDLGDVAHYYGESILEQAMNERFRYQPDWYVYIVGEMTALVVIPDLERLARERYAALRELGDLPPGESDFKRRFTDPDHVDMNRTIATLIAARFLKGADPSRFISIVNDGEELETAFRSAAVVQTPDAQTRSPSLVPVGTSFEAIVQQIEEQYQEERDN